MSRHPGCKFRAVRPKASAVDGFPAAILSGPTFSAQSPLAEALPPFTPMTQLGQALCDRFEEVSRAELIRLRRKMAGLSAEDRATVEALAVAVTQGIALRLDAGLAVVENATVGDTLARIFSLEPEGSTPLDQVSANRGDELGDRT